MQVATQPPLGTLEIGSAPVRLLEWLCSRSKGPWYPQSVKYFPSYQSLMSDPSHISENLCEGCSEVVVYLPRKVVQYDDLHGSRQLLREYGTLADLEELAHLGCAFCKLLYACHCRSAGANPAADCGGLKVYRVTRGHSLKHSFIKLECSHAYGWHSEHCLGVMPLTEGMSTIPSTFAICFLTKLLMQDG